MTKKIIFTLAFFLLLKTVLFGQTETKTLVYFDFNTSLLDTRAGRSLDSLVQYLKLTADYTVYLSGHTDSIGSSNYNYKLSESRVISVKDYLVAKKIDVAKIRFESYGKTKPILSNISLSNRVINRRVEITIFGPQKPSLTESKPVNTEIDKESSEKSKIEVPTIPYGNSTIAGYNITVITNTTEMEANNFTTMTVQDSALASNLIICWEPEKDKPIPKEPITLRVPAGKNPYCKLPQVSYYDSQKDSATGLINWNELLFPGWKSESINNIEYFTIVINPTDRTRRCANMDCKKLYETKSKLLLVSKKYTIKQVKIIYESANALMTGKESSKNLWVLRLWPISDVPPPTIKIQIIAQSVS